MAYTTEQYKAAGQWILANLGNPEAVRAKAKELGLSNADILKAAQTVNPGITMADVEKYLGPMTTTPTTPTTTTVSAPQDRFSTDQYKAAGQYILANLGDPALIATRAKEFGLTKEELLKAAKSIGYNNITLADIQGYLSKGNAAIQAQAAAEAERQRQAAAEAERQRQAAIPKDRFSTDQYKAAGDWVLKNFGDPKAVAAKAKELNLTNDELLKAVQTVDKNITLADVEGYLAKANAPAAVDFKTDVTGQPTTTRTGTGVAVTGESGLREGYAPYVQRLLERASAEADVPFQAYTGKSPLLESAKQGIANLTTPAQYLQGSNLAQAAGQGALEYGRYMPTAFTTGTFATPTSQVQTQGSPEEVKTNAVPKAQGGLMSLVGYDAGGEVNVGANTTPNSYTIPANPNIQPVNYGGQNVTNVQASYMSPYMQNVVDVQQQEAKRQANIANQAIGAKAVQAGAFGGTRHGLMESEADRNLLTQLGGIQAKGLQDAYTQGLGQFNIEQNRGLEAQKMGEQSRQFGAELGLRGLQTGIQAGQVLGNLGQQQAQTDLAILKQMADLGTADRNFDYNEFLRAEKYPYENLTFMKNMLTGLPISAAATGIDPMSQALTGGISTVALIDILNKIGTGSSSPSTTK